MLFINIKPDLLFELERNHLNLSHLYEIEKSYISDSPRGIPEALLSTLKRKGYLSIEGKITEQGKLFYELISDPNFSVSTVFIKQELKKIKGNYSEQFLEWWETYPTGDGWGEFATTRSFKTLKDECQVKYLEILNSNLVTHSNMIEAIKYMLYIKKKASNTGLNDNKLVYLQNTKTYLNQGTYNGYITLMKIDKPWQTIKDLKQEKAQETGNFTTNGTYQL